MPNQLNNPMRKQVFDFIVTFKQEHNGNSPTIIEIAEACGFASKNTAHFYLGILEKNGLISRPFFGASRMIEVTGGTWNPPTT